MIPVDISNYLDRHGVPWKHLDHGPAYDAQRLASSVHVSGDRLAKVVVVEADGTYYLCVLPASQRLSLSLVRDVLRAESVRLAAEREFAPLFSCCETGAEPPLGDLFSLPVVVDDDLVEEETLVMRGGTHIDCIEMPLETYLTLERPIVASIAVPERPPKSGRRADESTTAW